MRVITPIILALIIHSVSGAVAPLHRRTANRRPQQNPAPITATLDSFWFDVEVQFGNQTFFLLVDTGSSDTWVAATGYTCIDPGNNHIMPSQECMWAPTYNVPPSMHYIQNRTFGVQYGTGIALGKVGVESVTLGGITVPEQMVGIVDRTSDKGDGVNSGILGLGFPTLTSAHPGTILENDSISLITNRAIYDPLFVNMYKQGLVEPWYSIAIDRLPRDTMTGHGGWLGLGELPPVEHSDYWAAAPIEITKGIPDAFYQGPKPEISLMTLTVDSVSWGSSANSTITNTTKFQAVVDSGNNMNLVPIEVARSVNSLFVPPAEFNEDLGIFLVDCDAKGPDFGVTINGNTFWHNPVDMVSKDHSTGVCYSTLSGSTAGFGTEINFLGDAFLKNVVSVFDFAKTEMRFAARTGDQQKPTFPKPTPVVAGGIAAFTIYGRNLILALLIIIAREALF